MKRRILAAMLLLMCMTLFGCGTRYNVDYHGQKSLFKGAKASYRAGQEVRITYDSIATDTDYNFYVVGVDGYDMTWADSGHGYVITFIMPDHDIEVYCEHHNSMQVDPNAKK